MRLHSYSFQYSIDNLNIIQYTFTPWMHVRTTVYSKHSPSRSIAFPLDEGIIGDYCNGSIQRRKVVFIMTTKMSIFSTITSITCSAFFMVHGVCPDRHSYLYTDSRWHTALCWSMSLKQYRNTIGIARNYKEGNRSLLAEMWVANVCTTVSQDVIKTLRSSLSLRCPFKPFKFPTRQIINSCVEILRAGIEWNIACTVTDCLLHTPCIQLMIGPKSSCTTDYLKPLCIFYWRPCQLLISVQEYWEKGYMLNILTIWRSFAWAAWPHFRLVFAVDLWDIWYFQLYLICERVQCNES